MLWRDLITQATSELTLGVHKNLLKWVHAFQIELEFRYVGFWGEGKTGLPGEKPLRAKERIQGCALRKIEGSPVLWNCKIWGAQHMIGMRNLRFSSRPREKVRRQGPPGSARAQPWNQQQTQPKHGVDARIQTRAELVGGECSHHCTTLASH